MGKKRGCGEERKAWTNVFVLRRLPAVTKHTGFAHSPVKTSRDRITVPRPPAWEHSKDTKTRGGGGQEKKGGDLREKAGEGKGTVIQSGLYIIKCPAASRPGCPLPPLLLPLRSCTWTRSLLFNSPCPNPRTQAGRRGHARGFHARQCHTRDGPFFALPTPRANSERGRVFRRPGGRRQLQQPKADPDRRGRETDGRRDRD